jgi:hypothetical protein
LGSRVSHEVNNAQDGVKWSQPVARGNGELMITRVPLTPQNVRFIRITQTERSITCHEAIFKPDTIR